MHHQAILANPLLRFQRLDSRERAREAELHARHPVQNKLVANPRDWPWSSFSYYATGAPGVLTIDVTQ